MFILQTDVFSAKIYHSAALDKFVCLVLATSLKPCQVESAMINNERYSGPQMLFSPPHSKMVTFEVSLHLPQVCIDCALPQTVWLSALSPTTGLVHCSC